jgi:hypothetical protein
LAGFDLSATAGVVDFTISYPNFFAYRVAGGMLESFSSATGTGNSSGIAGPMPVPLAANASEAFPTNIPTTQIETPQEARAGWRSVDWASMPNQCKSEYPDLFDQGREDRSCGGPAQEDAKLGFTASMANGHSKSTGDKDDPLKATNESVSRGMDVSVPSLQMKIHDAWSKTKAGLNPDGVPESRSTVDIDSVAILTGLIQLNGIHSEAIATSDGTDAGSKFISTFSLQEAFVAGVPVVIGRDGVSVKSEALVPGTSMQDAAKQVSDALKGGDVQMRLIPAPATDKQAGHASSQAQGVEIIHQGGTFTPANSSYRFGFVSASANASRTSGESASSEAGLGTAGSDYTSGGAGTDGSGSAPAGSDASSVDTGSDPSSDASSYGGGDYQSSDEGSTSSVDLSSASSYDAGAIDTSSPTDVSVPTDTGTSTEAAAEGTGSGTEAAGTVELSQPPVLGAIPASRQSLPADKLKNVLGVVVLLGLLGAAAVPLRKLLL